MIYSRNYTPAEAPDAKVAFAKDLAGTSVKGLRSVVAWSTRGSGGG